MGCFIYNYPIIRPITLLNFTIICRGEHAYELEIKYVGFQGNPLKPIIEKLIIKWGLRTIRDEQMI